jgi:chromosomal replication initiator protein
MKPTPRNIPQLEAIKQTVCEYYELPIECMRARERTARLAEARFVAMWLARQLTGLTLAEIATGFDRHHADVLYGVRTIDSSTSVDRHLRNDVAIIRKGVAIKVKKLDQARKEAFLSAV